MTDVSARDGPVQMELGLPVLFSGYRPKKRRSERRQVSVEHQMPVQLTLDGLIDQLDAMDDAGASPNESFGDDQRKWTQDDVRRLHVFLLDRSIEVLADPRTHAGTVTEILAWVQQTPSRPEPGFSYRMCCEVCGYDADALAEQLIMEVSRLRSVQAA